MIHQTFKLGDKVRFRPSWLVPKIFHGQTATLIDGSYTSDGKRLFLLCVPAGTEWLRALFIARAAELV